MKKLFKVLNFIISVAITTFQGVLISFAFLAIIAFSDLMTGIYPAALDVGLAICCLTVIFGIPMTFVPAMAKATVEAKSIE